MSTPPGRNSEWTADRRPLCSGRDWQDTSSGGQLSSGPDFRSQNLASPPIRKSPKNLHGDVCSSWLAETFCKKKKMCLISWTPPSPKAHIYWLSPCLFGAISQNYPRFCLPGWSPHFTLNKTWLAGGSAVKKKKNLPANAEEARDLISISGPGRSPEGGNGNPLQYTCLENPHGQRTLEGYIKKGWTRLSTHSMQLLWCAFFFKSTISR